jgi:hypothetical protein
VSATGIIYDMQAPGRRQRVRILEAVWPIIALYTRPLGWLIHVRLGHVRLATAAQRITALALNSRRRCDARPRANRRLISASYREVIRAACEH